MASIRFAPILGLGLLVSSLSSCAAHTMYRGIPVASLTDEQLVNELESAVRGFGLELDRTLYLTAVRPEPAYVLTSSETSFVGSGSATYNAYVMPMGYGTRVTGSVYGTASGSTTTRYQYTDVRAAERLGNSIAAAISQSRRESYRRRGLEVHAEYQRRVASRRLETERVIEDFFATNPSLQGRRLLVAAAAPWAAAEGGAVGRAVLERAKEIITSLPRGAGLSGTWFGTFAQTNRSPDGDTFSFSEFVRINLTQEGELLGGTGVLGSGDTLELVGRVTDSQISAAVANTTSAINVRMTAVAAATQITGTFTGAGAGVQMKGTFTLLR